MIDAAHASRFFWEEIGTPVNHARGEWQISRTYAAAGGAEPALYQHGAASRSTRSAASATFDLAYAYEALARAHAVAGETDAAARYEKQAREAAEHIAEQDDRDLVLSDLATRRSGGC